MSNQKSGLLDQLLMDDIARHCPQQFLAFHQCLGKKDPGPENCEPEQMALAKCIRQGVPAFQRIQGVCAGRLQAYEACLKMNGSDVKKCAGDLEVLRDCAFSSLEK